VKVVLIDYGAGNLHSVQKALVAAEIPPVVSSDPNDLDDADAIVLPGQGHFGQVAEAFAASGFAPRVREHLAASRPFLGICVGLQLLMERSDEAPGVAGLGLIAGRVRRFPDAGPSVPHMGWNSLHPVGASPLLEGIPDGAHAYFAHSYYAEFLEQEWSGAYTRYGDVTFLSAVSRGAVHATQFHPEKSQRVGLHVLRRFGIVARQAARRS